MEKKLIVSAVIAIMFIVTLTTTASTAVFSLNLTTIAQPSNFMAAITNILTGIQGVANQITLLFTPSGLSISSGDGLDVSLSEDGKVTGLTINGIQLEMLAGNGGFSFSEFTTNTITNLVLNPGFEQGSTIPINWSFVSTDGNTPTWDTISHNGAKSVKISISGTSDKKSGYPQSDRIKAEPLAYYTFSAWVKTEGAGGTNKPAVRAAELDANMKWLRQTDLHFSKGTNDWERKQVSFRTGFDTAYVYIYANIWNGYGTFWVDDVELLIRPTVYLNGTLTQNPDGSVIQKAQANDIDFTFTYIPRNRYIEIQGKMQDLKGRDRALQVSYNLPLNASGWKWGDYIRGSREINASTRYENVNQIGNTRIQNTYPFASIDNGISGLSIAVPMNVPRVYRMEYNSSTGYSIQYDFGLSPQTLKIGPGYADFTFIIYKADEPEWGFRSAVKKYYEIYPQFFEKRNTREGTLNWIGDMSKLPDPFDFGFASEMSDSFAYSWRNSKQRFNMLNGIYSFQYTEPWGWWRFFSKDDSTKPSYEERMAALNSDLANTTSTWRDIVPLSTAAQAVYNSAPYDKNGKMYLDDVSYYWNYWGAWMQNYPTNPDPDIPSPNRFESSYKKYQMASSKQGGFIDDWLFEPDGFWDSTVSHNLGHSAKIEIVGNESKISGRWINDAITVKPNTTYTFSAWGKTENTGGTHSPAVRIVQIDTNGAANYSTQRDLIFGFGMNDWTQKKLTFTTLNNTAKIFIYANIWKGYGRFWFDDVELYEQNSAINLVSNSGLELNSRGEKTNYELDGVSLDSLLSVYMWPTLENYRRQHWQYTDLPLVFSYETMEPVLLGVMSQYEYIDYLEKDIHSNNRLLHANFFPEAYSFYAHLIDISGSEIGNVESDKTASQRRTLSYQKTNTNLMTWQWGNSPEPISSADIEKYLRNSTFYGIFPSVSDAGGTIVDPDVPQGFKRYSYWDDSSLYERDRPLFKKYIPIIKEVAKAGWEPIPYAVISSNEAIMLERYGNSNTSVYYTLRNETGSNQSGTLSIDLTKLGISGIGSITELVTNKTQYISGGGKISLEVSLADQETKVYRLNPDTTAPAAITNLTASGPTSNSVVLTWTSPGDDGSTGTAASYDIRYATSTITESNWASAAQVSGEPTPLIAGTSQSMTVSGLNASTIYYFAMKTSDEVPNVSALSNVAKATTLTPTPTCASLTFPTDKWQRVWYDKSLSQCFGNGPDEINLKFNNNWRTRNVAWGKRDNIGFKSSRTINFSASGNYTFKVGSDDGVRVWIDGTLRLDKWYNRSYKTNSFKVYLTAGSHKFEIDWYENTGSARVSFTF